MKNFILVTDDTLLADYIAGLSHNLMEVKFEKIFANSTSALMWIANNEVNVVFIDMFMFDNDALVLAEKISKNYPNINVVLISDFITKNLREFAHTVGVNMIIPSNCTKEMLLNIVNQIIETENEKLAVNTSRKDKLIDERISNICISVGIPPNILGYTYFREAIKVTAFNPDMINKVTKELYPYLAQKFNTTYAKVERALRHAIEIACENGNIKRINDLLGLEIIGDNKRLTSSEFIALVSDKISFDFL
ncbi:MAG: response regulator [Clostridia bacterium]|nr:response regulator [Clostridia bacterium]